MTVHDVEPTTGASRPGRGVAHAEEAATSARALAAVLPALVAVTAAVLLVEVARVALLTRTGQDLDQQAMESVYGGTRAMRNVLDLLGQVSIGSAALVLGTCVVLAVLRRRYAVAVAAVVLVGGANVTTQLLKRVVLERPDFGNLTVVSLPSGHTTVAVSLAMAALLVVPRALRPVAVLGGTALAVVTGAGTVVAQWHRPADVIAAVLVCVAWAGAVLAVLAWRRPRTVAWTGTARDLAAALVGAAAAGAVLLLAGVRPEGGWSGVEDAALTLAVLGVGTALAVAVVARLADPHRS